MYVWGRLLKIMVTLRQRGRYEPGGVSRLAIRCLPTDIDFNFHLNNARYLMMADLGRLDIYARTGLMKLCRQRGWVPMLGGAQSVFVREIKLWRRFEVLSSIETWEGTTAIGRHNFILDNGETAATVMTTGGIYDRENRQFLPVDRVLAALGVGVTPRPPTDVERSFMASHSGLRKEAKFVL